jgi:hypothetical protein
MKHSKQFTISFLLISSFTYLLVKPPMKPRPSWKGFLSNRMRGGDTYSRWNFSHYIQKASTISKISLQNIRIYCRNSRLVGLINMRRNKWFSPFSSILVLNSQCLYPNSIQSNSPLEPPGICLLLRNLLNP